jgi:hypothetical protein
MKEKREVKLEKEEKKKEKEKWNFVSPSIIDETKKKGGKYFLSEKEYTQYFPLPSFSLSFQSPLVLLILIKEEKPKSRMIF